MGQFLAIGLATRIRAKKTETDKAGLGMGQLQEAMEKKFYYPPEIYIAADRGEFYEFTLKDDIFHGQLIPFLKTIYPLLYEDKIYYSDIIERLEAMAPSEWLSWAEGKPDEVFQMDEYGASDYLENNCQVPCDYIPKRSYPLFQASEVLRLLVEEAAEESKESKCTGI